MYNGCIYLNVCSGILGCCRGMDIFSSKNVVVIVFLHRIVSNLPDVLKSVEAVFRTVCHIL